MRKKSKVEDKHIVSGQVTYSESGQPAADMKVTVMDADRFIDKDLGGSFTDGNGKFHIVYDVAQFRDRFRLTPNIYLIIQDSKGKIITTTENAVVKNAGATQEIFVQLQGKGPEEEKPTIEVGGVRVNRIVFDKLKPEELLAIAEYAIHGHGRKQILKTIQELSQELDPEFLRSQLCFTPLTDFLRETVYVKQWSRDVRLRLEEILTGYDPEAGYISHNCPHFRINYENTGGDQPPATDSGGNITMPGTGAVVGSTVGGNGVPDYIEKLCFWLESALAIYTSPPFNLRNPASGGRIPVNVTGTSPGSAGGGSMTIGRNLNDDLLAAVPTHELMHLIQDLYATAGTGGGWNPGMKEGGAVLGEDVVFDTHNRYIVQAGSGIAPYIP